MDDVKKEEAKKVRMVVEEVGESEVKPQTQEVVNEVKKEEVVVEPSKEVVPPTPVPIAITDEKEVKEKSSFNALWILIPGMLLLGLLIGGVFAYVLGIQRLSETNKEGTPEPGQTIEASASPSSSPKPSASPSASLTKYKIKVLNGSGIKGEATKVQTILEKAGYVVLSTGNAATYDFKKTLISVKTGTDTSFTDSLITLLEKTYQVETKTLSTQTNDVTVTIGSLKSE